MRFSFLGPRKFWIKNHTNTSLFIQIFIIDFKHIYVQLKSTALCTSHALLCLPQTEAKIKKKNVRRVKAFVVNFYGEQISVLQPLLSLTHQKITPHL